MAQAHIDHAAEILRENDLGHYTVPTHGLYPFQWNWDSCLTALGLSQEASQSRIDRLRNQVRVKLPEGYPSLDTIAEELGQSVSAVQRTLAFEGLSYKDLVENTRRDLALLYLKQVHMPLSEIAFLLGYSELSAFSRAFRRWHGVSPRDYRDQLARS